MTGSSLEDVRRQMVDATPPGNVLASGPVKTRAGTVQLAATGTYVATAVEDIEADDRAALQAKVPDGWRLLNVRRVE